MKPGLENPSKPPSGIQSSSPANPSRSPGSLKSPDSLKSVFEKQKEEEEEGLSWWRKLLHSFWFWGIFLVILMGASCLLGAVQLSLSDLKDLFSNPNSMAYAILVHYRLPRTLACVLCGASLGISGYILQSVLNNPLAAPSSLGLLSGAGFGRVLAGVLFPTIIYAGIPASFLGCVLCGGLILFLAMKTGASRTTLILAGLAVGQIFSAGTDLLVSLFDDALAGYASFKIGNFAGIPFEPLKWIALLMVLGMAIALLCSQELEILSLSRENAQALGLNAPFWMSFFCLLACTLAASVVCIAGLIGFIGLMVPHMVRSARLHTTRQHLVGCLLQGPCLLLLCDLLARLLFIPYEIPTGIVVSLLGGPYFLFLLFRMRKRR